MTLRLVAAALAGVLLLACGAAAGERRTASSIHETSLARAAAPPSKRLLAGTWRQVRGTVRIRFGRDGAFRIGNRLDTPFAVGTYALSGSSVRFKPVGPWCVDPWVWRVSVLKDDLDVVFVTRACDVAKGTKWRFARLS